MYGLKEVWVEGGADFDEVMKRESVTTGEQKEESTMN